MFPLILALQFCALQRNRAENQVDSRYEDYSEDNGRIHVQTESIFFDQELNSRLSLSGEFVYDAISGASPTGAPPPDGSKQVPLAHMEDTRYAGNLQAHLHLANHTLSPQFAYSQESDYRSIGVSLGDAIDFNEKNTTLVLGISHDFDSQFPKFYSKPKDKDTTDALLGVNQLLGPRTVLSANLTIGYASGDLNDPYKRMRFDGYPDPTATFSEKRPGHKFKQVGLLSLTHFFEPVNGSAEVSYRLYHDSYSILSHTISLAWYQHAGKHFIIAPIFRYDYQGAADFYVVRLPGDPSDPTSTIPIPRYYSADYRLSRLESFTYGVQVTWIIKEWLYLDVGYKRYEMHGLDHVTSASAYPKANIITGGLRLLW